MVTPERRESKSHQGQSGLIQRDVTAAINASAGHALR